MSTASFAELPIDILAILSSFLYAKSATKLYCCGNKALNLKLGHYGGLAALRFHLGHKDAFHGRGAEHRGHYTPVPLHFPMEGIDGGSQPKTMARCLSAIKYFRNLKVLSIYGYRAFAKFDPHIAAYLTLEAMQQMPKTLEVIEMRFPGAIAVFLADRHDAESASNSGTQRSQNLRIGYPSSGYITQLNQAATISMKSNPWLPLGELFPTLRCLAIHSYWDEMLWNHQVDHKELVKHFIESLPPFLEELSADFLPLTHSSIPKASKHPRFHTYVCTNKESAQSWVQNCSSIMKALSPKTVTRLDLPQISLHVSQMAWLPPLLQSLEIADINDTARLDGPFPFPPELSKLIVSSISRWDEQLVARIPPSIHVLHVRKLERDNLFILSKMHAISFGCDSYTQSRYNLKFFIDEFSILPPGLRHLRVCLSPAFRTSVAFKTPIFTALQTLVLTGGGNITDSCLLALPATLCHLDVEMIRTTGVLLPEDTKIVSEATLKQSIKSYVRAKLPLLQAIPPISCLAVTSVPLGVEEIRDVDYSMVEVLRLQHLKILHYKAGIDSKGMDFWRGLPASVTQVDLIGSTQSISSQTLGWAPNTLTRVSGGVVWFPGSEFSTHMDSIHCASLTLPDNFAQVIDGWAQIEMTDGCNILFGGSPIAKIASLPTNLESLCLIGTGVPSLKLCNLPSHPYSTTSRRFDLLPGCFPKSLKRIELKYGALASYPLRMLPDHIEELHILEHRINDETFSGLSRFKDLKTLAVHGEVAISDGAVKFLPPNLVSLAMDSKSLSEASIPHFPSTLTSLKLLPDSIVTQEKVLAHIGSQKSDSSA